MKVTALSIEYLLRSMSGELENIVQSYVAVPLGQH